VSDIVKGTGGCAGGQGRARISPYSHTFVRTALTPDVRMCICVYVYACMCMCICVYGYGCVSLCMGMGVCVGGGGTQLGALAEGDCEIEQNFLGTTPDPLAAARLPKTMTVYYGRLAGARGGLPPSPT
jgi:hypothetical protein